MAKEKTRAELQAEIREKNERIMSLEKTVSIQSQQNAELTKKNADLVGENSALNTRSKELSEGKRVLECRVQQLISEKGNLFDELKSCRLQCTHWEERVIDLMSHGIIHFLIERARYWRNEED